MERERFEIKIERIIAVVTAIIASFLILGGQISFAQVVRKKLPTVTNQAKRIFKGNGVTRQHPELDKFKDFSPPAEPSLANLSSIFGDVLKANGMAVKDGISMPVEIYAEITNRTTFVANKAAIDFVRPLKVDAAHLFSAYEPGNAGFDINIMSDRADKWFMISCGINTSPNSVFRIFGPDGTTSETILDGSGYLHTYLLAQTSGWQKLEIRGDKSYWMLLSCKVTTPKLP
jgi:hypothetical protein